MSREEQRLLLIGCGNMGRALLQGWLARGFAPGSIRVIDPSPSAQEAARALGIEAGETLADPGWPPDAVILAVKPDQLEGVLREHRPLVQPNRTFLGIAAGKRIAAYREGLGADAAVVRAMPNTPAAIGRGMTVLCAGPGVSAQQRALCSELMSAVGEVAWVDEEAALDPVTAVSGSGPAYVFLLIEALTAAAIDQGLPKNLARRLALTTVAGAGAYALASDEDAAQLRRRVTSPGGTTQAALEVLMRSPGLIELVRQAVEAATERSRELG